ncbi:MAG TPA: DNA mismatch repair protein MutS, partial [Acidithiobacillus sp.]|nr:DNA mismatch repair protein MutS [Acidithiobacillus sp.]
MEADLKPLEFEGIRRLLEKLCATPFGADAARNLAPAPTPAVARQLQAAITAARFGLESGEGPILPELPDVRAAIRQVASPGAALAGTAFRNLALVLRVGAQLRPYVEKRPALLPAGPEHLDAAADLLPRIDAVLMPNGSMREDGNDTLRQLHGELKTEREQIQKTLQGHLRAPGAKVHWSGQRACVHLPDGAVDNIRGVRRGTGPGGHGTLVEPMEMVAGNNHLEKLAGRIEQENQAILRALSDAARARLNGLQ